MKAETYFQCAYMATQQAAWYDVLIDWAWVTDNPYDDATLANVHRIRDRRKRQAQKFNEAILFMAQALDRWNSELIAAPAANS